MAVTERAEEHGEHLWQELDHIYSGRVSVAHLVVVPKSSFRMLTTREIDPQWQKQILMHSFNQNTTMCMASLC